MPDFRSRPSQFSIVIVLVLLLVIEFESQQIEHEHESEHDYEVASTPGLPSVAARANAGWRRDDLLTWFRIGGTKSANEVAQIINEIEQFAERRSAEVIRR